MYDIIWSTIRLKTNILKREGRKYPNNKICHLTVQLSVNHVVGCKKSINKWHYFSYSVKRALPLNQQEYF